MEFKAMRGAIAVILVLSVHCVHAGELVPTLKEQTEVAPQHVHFMSRGAAADSFALRVSLSNDIFLFSESHSWLVIEELAWPIPIPGLDFDPKTKEFTQRSLQPDDFLRTAVRVDGDFFHERAFEMLKPMVYVQGTQEPLVFQGWLSPTQFAVSYWRIRFVLRRTAPGLYELVGVGKIDEG